MTEDEQILAMEIADLFRLHPPERIEAVLTEAMRLAVERAQARERRRTEGTRR